MIYGYARVSTDGQSVDTQVRRLRAAGAHRVFREVASGARADRPGLRRAIAKLEEGDVLMVTRLDRLARSTRDLLSTLAAIAEKNAGLRSRRTRRRSICWSPRSPSNKRRRSSSARHWWPCAKNGWPSLSPPPGWRSTQSTAHSPAIGGAHRQHATARDGPDRDRRLQSTPPGRATMQASTLRPRQSQVHRRARRRRSPRLHRQSSALRSYRCARRS